ncbi:MAG: HAMP domain-containing histidine kinase [Flavobacteriaceae bacterium]|nr:HAMP domain-containing histidine kinase [Flavobacteriaceae bacterium]
MKSIKGRILLAFLALCLLITPLLLFSYRSLRKINSVKTLKEQLAEFNTNRLNSIITFSLVLDNDTKIDSFYQFGTTQNIKKYHEFIAKAAANVSRIDPTDHESEAVMARRLSDMQGHIHQLDSAIVRALGNRRERGFRDFGIEGAMRDNIQRLEFEAQGISLAENLSIRRSEKDFFLRDDLDYAQEVVQLCDSILDRMALDRETNEASIAILTAYRRNFDRIMVLENELGNKSFGLINDVYLINGQIDSEISKLFEIVDSDLRLLTESVKSYLILFFMITTAFAVIFAFVFSGHIAKPIQRLIDDMAFISEKDFSGDFGLKSPLQIRELQQLTKTYNSLVQKIRSQIESLNKKNGELNTLNLKLKESEDEIKEASVMKDKFFSIISHDLRGHTANIVSLAQVLGNKKADLPEAQKETFIKYLSDASKNLELLLDNLLNWAKSQMKNQEIVKKAFDINKLIQANFELFNENAAKKGIELVFNYNSVHRAYADKDMIDFVIRNLLSNALKFTASGDMIRVDVFEKQEFLEINVRDTGVGMTKDQIKRLLASKGEGFTTTGTDNEKGTGLGFSICKDFIAKNGGSIQVRSVKGQGSNFSFTVPTSLTKEAIFAS